MIILLGIGSEKLKFSKKLNVLLGLSFLGKFLPIPKRRSRDLNDNAICPRCLTLDESIFHLFRDFGFSKNVWDKVLNSHRLSDFYQPSCKEWLLENFHSTSKFNNIPGNIFFVSSLEYLDW